MHLLEGGHSVVAGRLAGAFRHLSRPDIADEITKTMKAAGYDIRLICTIHDQRPGHASAFDAHSKIDRHRTLPARPQPMYVAVLSLIFGQALLWADALVLAYRALIAAGFHLFVIFYEEPTLMRAFAAEYTTFRANVPRCIARLTPSRPDNVSH